MNEPISIQINGGNNEERTYVSDVVEGALIIAGFSEVQNTIIDNTDELSDDRTKTLFDYAINKNPDLFAQPITISTDAEPAYGSVDENNDEEESETEVDDD